MDELKQLDKLDAAVTACALDLAHLMAVDATIDAYTLAKIDAFRDARTAYMNAWEAWKKNRQGSGQ